MLGGLLAEIRDNMASNASFAAELQYWQGLSRKVRQKMAVKKIEGIYRLFLKKNSANIEYIQAEKRAKELQEESKSAHAGRFRKTFVKLSL